MSPTAKCYEIQIEEPLSQLWQAWFSEVEITKAGTGTRMTGWFSDQAALFGLLARIRDLNLTLVSVQRVPAKRDE